MEQRNALMEVPSKEEYCKIMSNVLMYGGACMALTMVQETGILKVLDSSDQPLTSSEIAHKANLKERYVREVLRALAAARVIQLHDGVTKDSGNEDHLCYSVPDPHRAVLDMTSPGCFSTSAAFQRYAEVKDCFPKDSTACVRYNETIFHLIDGFTSYILAPSVELILEIDGLKNKLEKGIRVCEVGCGFARPTRRLAKLFPASHFTATDVEPSILQTAKQGAEEEGLTNMSFSVLDVCVIPEGLHEQFDLLVASSVIHDLPAPTKAVQGIQKVLKPGGVFAMIDVFVQTDLRKNVGDATAAWLYSLSTFLCIPESYQDEKSEALGAGWGEQKARAIVEGAGLKIMSITTREPMGAMALFNCQKPE